MKWMSLIFAAVLTTPLYCQDLPDAPSYSARTTVESKSTQTTGTVRKDKPFGEERTWNETFTGKGARLFWLEQAGVVAVNVFDIEVTHQGLAHHNCVEKGENPYPSRGEMYAHDMPFTAGVIAWNVVMRKLRIPFAGHVVSAISMFKHGRGGTKWLTQCW